MKGRHILRLGRKNQLEGGSLPGHTINHNPLDPKVV
jgi:hypothetical protein